MKKETWLPGEIYKNRKLVFSLAKNDFKTKYAGSYFGTVWAFVQPIVTICVYWFVFGLALRNGSDMIASRIASEMASHILSGWPSVTDSEVNKIFSFSIVNLFL